MTHDPLHDPLLDGLDRWYATAGTYSLDGTYIPDGTYVRLDDLPDLITRVRDEEFTHRITAAVMSAEMAYDIALQDATKAITRLCHHTKYEGCSPCPHDDAVHAIEQLGDPE